MCVTLFTHSKDVFQNFVKSSGPDRLRMQLLIAQDRTSKVEKVLFHLFFDGELHNKSPASPCFTCLAN